jgi:hypothetical protein
VPAEHARAEFELVVHSARATAENFAFVSGRATGLSVWLGHWGRTALYDLYDIFVPGLVAVLAGFVLVGSYRKASGAERRKARRGWLMLAPPGIALAAWAVVAPMPYYGAPFFWTLAALLGSQAFRLRQRSPNVTRRVFAAACMLGATPCLVTPVWSYLQSPSGRNVSAAVLDANVKLTDRGGWLQAGEPEPQLQPFTTRTGLVLNVPVGSFGRCWNAPLPCTPNPAPNLRLRIPGRIESGFAVDGEWQMRDWPERWRPGFLPALREAWRRRDGTASVR